MLVKIEPPSSSVKGVEPLRFAVWTNPSERAKPIPLEVNPDSTQQWSVTFDVLMGGWVIGTDRGVLWFDDQKLYIVGEQTSFAIPGHRITANPEKRFEILRPLQRRFSVDIEAGTTTRLSLEIDVIMSAPFVPESLAFMEAVRNCHRQSDPNVEGQLPPITVTSTAHTPEFLRRMLYRHLLKAGSLAILCMAFIGLIVEDVRLNPLFALALSGASIFQVAQWASPKFRVLLTALKSSKAFAKGDSGHPLGRE